MGIGTLRRHHAREEPGSGEVVSPLPGEAAAREPTQTPEPPPAVADDKSDSRSKKSGHRAAP